MAFSVSETAPWVWGTDMKKTQSLVAKHLQTRKSLALMEGQNSDKARGWGGQGTIRAKARKQSTDRT